MHWDCKATYFCKKILDKSILKFQFLLLSSVNYFTQGNITEIYETISFFFTAESLVDVWDPLHDSPERIRLDKWKESLSQHSELQELSSDNNLRVGVPK